MTDRNKDALPTDLLELIKVRLIGVVHSTILQPPFCGSTGGRLGRGSSSVDFELFYNVGGCGLSPFDHRFNRNNPLLTPPLRAMAAGRLRRTGF